ncbi:MAG: hypothetical protein ABFD75_00880, partial [Smithella sp.]
WLFGRHFDHAAGFIGPIMVDPDFESELAYAFEGKSVFFRDDYIYYSLYKAYPFHILKIGKTLLR